MGARARSTWVAVAATGVAVALGAGCASEADPEAYADVVTEAREAEASPEAGGDTAAFLAEAADQSSSEAYRVSISMSMSVSGFDGEASESYGFEGEVITGAQDGDAFEIHLDMSGPMADLAAQDGEEFPLDDLSMDIVGDDEVLYIRAPAFAQLAELSEEPGEPVEDWMTDIGELGDTWGRVDLTALDDLGAGDIQGALTGPGMSDPQAMFDALAEAGTGETEALGTEVIDGVEAHGTRFLLPVEELFGEGAFADAADAESGLDEEEMSEFVEAFLGDIPVEVWVDDEGYVRRLSFEIDMGEMLGGFAGLGDEEDAPEVSMTMGSTMDFTDYGDPSIEIEFPDEADTVDVTEAFRSLAEGD